jgi:hypothetical protein
MSTAKPATLDQLPLFVTEDQLAAAVMGPGKTREWRQIAPLLEQRGFPEIDGLMGGRYLPAVKAFFDREWNVHGGHQVKSPHKSAELTASWRKRATTPRQG